MAYNRFVRCNLYKYSHFCHFWQFDNVEKNSLLPMLTLLTLINFDNAPGSQNTLGSQKNLEPKGRVQKKNLGKSMVFYQTRGGSPRVMKKPNCFFGKVCFQWACRIILGPPKHVLHLVWSAYIISTAIRAALKIAQRSRILGKRRPVIQRKFNCFWNETKRKICFSH